MTDPAFPATAIGRFFIPHRASFDADSAGFFAGFDPSQKSRSIPGWWAGISSIRVRKRATV